MLFPGRSNGKVSVNWAAPVFFRDIYEVLSITVFTTQHDNTDTHFCTHWILFRYTIDSELSLYQQLQLQK